MQESKNSDGKFGKKKKKDREDPTRLKNNSVKKNLTILFLFTNYFLFVRRIYAYVMWTSSFTHGTWLLKIELILR